MAVASIVYALCAATSLGCCVLLFKSFRERGVRLLLWSALCFAGLTLNNLILFVDLVVVPNVDLSLLRGLTAAGSLLLLVYGLVWDTK